MLDKLRPRLTNNYLTLSGVRFGYRDRLIIDGVDMQFRRGSVTALMGGSGSGKTTILRLIGGQVSPQQGKVIVDDQDIHALVRKDLYQARRKMGMLFQHGALFTDLNVFDNVAFALREHTDLDEALIHDLVLMKLQAVGLRGAHQLKTSQLSGGMARRVALARAIALDPPLMLYDEPFAGLDPISLGTIAELIRKLNDALGTTSVLVTHDVPESFAIADYVYLLGNGKIVVHGTPEELKATDNPYARQFLDAQRDGPVAFHYPAAPMHEDFGVGPGKHSDGGQP
jgi:phospholipid/cholesterol/gamma-HCH transport system ATP-binding protein